MSFPNKFYNNNRPDKVESSNHGKQIPSDDKRRKSQKKTREVPVQEKTGNVLRDSSLYQKVVVFKHGMEERETRRELFILEGDDGFENRSLRSKMTEVVKKGSVELKEWFYEKETSGDLPNTWEEFGDELVKFCSGRNIESMYRYQNESWSEYCIRSQEWSCLKNCREEVILKKLGWKICQAK
jgi:hypothetical protein